MEPDAINFNYIFWIIIALILWAIVFYKPVKNKVNRFFAHRRQLRRDRAALQVH